MSGFEENPFVDPTIDNPFADPSVQQVTQNASASLRIDDYNPFDKQGQKVTAGQLDGINVGPAVMQPTQELPSYTKTGQTYIKPTLNTEELQRRQEELERKEQELKRREEEMLRSQQYNVRRNNWPPLPDQCCFQPCFYQDIEVDIPEVFQKIVYQLYHLWMFHGIVMLLNVLGGIILLDFQVIALGIFYALLFAPFSYLCWFRPAYKAFRSDSSFNFMVFFFIFFFQFIITVCQAIGIPGTIGIITAVSTFGESVGSIFKGILALIIAVGFATAAVGDLFLITKIHRIYRSSGASLAKAQEEFKSEFLSNQHVRGVATNVAAAAVQSQFNQRTNNTRY